MFHDTQWYMYVTNNYPSFSLSGSNAFVTCVLQEDATLGKSSLPVDHATRLENLEQMMQQILAGGTTEVILKTWVVCFMCAQQRIAALV